MALTDEADERAGKKPKPVIKHVLRVRTIMYTSLWSLVGVGLLFALFVRAEIEMTVAPVRNPTFVTMSDGTIRNTYEVRLLNKHGTERQFHITVAGDPTIRVVLEGTPYGSVKVPADKSFNQRVYLQAPGGSAPAQAERSDVRLWVEDTVNGERAYKDTIFNGKGN